MGNTTQRRIGENEQAPRVKDSEVTQKKQPVEEIGGVKGPEPTRYGDWEKNGRCVDF